MAAAKNVKVQPRRDGAMYLVPVSFDPKEATLQALADMAG
jgi:hypothetical protein